MAETASRKNSIPTEKAIVNSIKQYLNNLSECYAVKTHGSIYGAGQPDLLGCCQGRTLALEVKRPGNKPTKLQLATLQKWEAAGAIVGVVTSVDEVKKLLEVMGNAQKEQKRQKRTTTKTIEN